MPGEPPLGGRADALAARRREDESRGVAKRARGGGRRLDDGIVVDPELRGAVEAVLGDAATAGWSPPRMPSLAGERGVAVVERPPTRAGTTAVDRGGGEFLGRVAELGGGRLLDVVRVDPPARSGG